MSDADVLRHLAMLELGSKAPSFALPSSAGGTASLAGCAGKVVVLYFYPRDNTPGCTIEAQEFRDLHRQLASVGAVVFGVSGDSLASHAKFRDKLGLPFALLSDANHAMMSAYGAWGDKVLYGKKITGVIRSTVIVDKHGKIARRWPKVTVKGHAAEVLAAVRSLTAGASSPSAVEAVKASGVKKATVKKATVKKATVKKATVKKSTAKKAVAAAKPKRAASKRPSSARGASKKAPRK